MNSNCKQLVLDDSSLISYLSELKSFFYVESVEHSKHGISYCDFLLFQLFLVLHCTYTKMR
jgi:hypothetical protein